MYEKFQTIGILLIIALWFFVCIKLLLRRLGPVRTVRAKVVDKHKTETFSRYSGTGKSVRYVVTFEIDGKRKGFYVSEFSYSGYRKGEAGILKYKGDKIIDFK